MKQFPSLTTSLVFAALVLWLPSLVLRAGLPTATPTQRVSLNGTWKFTADYQNAGDNSAWFSPSYSDRVWDQVNVPHTWSHDPRFMGFVGAGWYRLHFIPPAVTTGQHVRLNFGAVFARARVWLNGRLLGSHEGGYTPFDFDVGPALIPGKSNLLVVCADNRWDTTTIPGARGGGQPPEQVYAWWDDGGLIRDIALHVTPAIYVTKQKVEAQPDLTAGTATVRIRTWVHNATAETVRVRVVSTLTREGQDLPVAAPGSEISVPAGTERVAEQSISLAADHVRLWSLDTPTLYQAQTRAGEHAADPVGFGLRSFEVRGEQLLLNGHPIRLAGANWHASHPDWGQDQPASGVIRDLELMKRGGFVFQRLSHYPVSPVILDWADRHGMLLIAEAGNTGWKASQLANPAMQRMFRAQHLEMMERDWNHPSIIAWSVGNEFESDSPEGLQWVQSMQDFTRKVDPTRLVTFVSNRASKSNLKPADEGSHLVDFVCLNTYGGTPQANAENIDRVHGRYPGKPLLVTEYGLRHDFVDDEAERVDWFRAMLAIFRERPFIAGASIWSFNDYRSRYVGTNPNGWREWGLIAPDRTPRTAYHALRREHSGFIVRQATLTSSVITVRIEPRADFPVFPPADCELHIRFMDGQHRQIATQTVPLLTGEPLKISAPEGTSGFRMEIRRGGESVASFGPVVPQ